MTVRSEPVAPLLASEGRTEPPSDFGKNVHDFLHQYVNIADTKAGATLSVDLAISGLLVAHLPGGGVLIVYVLALAFLVLSSVASVAVIYPRTAYNPQGLIFWEGILTRKTFDQYYEAIRHLDAEEIEREFAIQNWHVSKVLLSKYQWTQRSILLFLIGAGIALVGTAFR